MGRVEDGCFQAFVKPINHFYPSLLSNLRSGFLGKSEVGELNLLVGRAMPLGRSSHGACGRWMVPGFYGTRDTCVLLNGPCHVLGLFFPCLCLSWMLEVPLPLFTLEGLRPTAARGL